MAKKILVVDDEHAVVRYMTTLFEDHGYEAIAATDGAEALKVLDETVPDLITLDLQMDKVWGPQFYRKMSKNQALKEIPVIVVSGLARPELAIKKAAAVVSKPFDPDELIRIVRDLIGG
ncbi:MAG: response regulator [Deltaproteobacteria bacterium]|nr:response regulator [Deltaproteobacteria bacterium]